MFGEPESTARDSHAANPTRTTRFINKSTESEISLWIEGSKCPRLEVKRKSDSPSASFLFLMELEIREN